MNYGEIREHTTFNRNREYNVVSTLRESRNKKDSPRSRAAQRDRPHSNVHHYYTYAEQIHLAKRAKQKIHDLNYTSIS